MLQVNYDASITKDERARATLHLRRPNYTRSAESLLVLADQLEERGRREAAEMIRTRVERELDEETPRSRWYRGL
jgi:ribose 1,5-bisphosphokinase PhnN